MSSPNHRKGQLINAASVLQDLLRNSNSRIATQFQRWQLWSQWPQIVGTTMSKNCYPVGYEQGTLIVFVVSSVHLQEISFLSREIMYKVNSFVGRRWVRRIRYTLDRHLVPKAEEADEKFRQYIDPK